MIFLSVPAYELYFVDEPDIMKLAKAIVHHHRVRCRLDGCNPYYV